MGMPLRLTAPEEALAALLALLPGPVAPRRLPVAAALGRVLAAPLVAPAPVPVAPMVLQHGWAVASAETLGAGPYSPVLLAAAPVRVAPGATGSSTWAKGPSSARAKGGSTASVPAGSRSPGATRTGAAASSTGE